tara:strand:- start:74 stop:457 length:384 start_codon:yes stop_codon:yes gene_type:complete
MELAIITWLMVKHSIADYFLQTSWMIEEKADYGKAGGLFHAGEHGVLSIIVLLFFINPFFAILLGLLDFILHYHIDWTKSNYLRGRFSFSPIPMDSDDPQYWWAMGLDQLAHYLTYALMVLIVLWLN